MVGLSYSLKLGIWQCAQIGRQYEIKNKAAIALQCKLNGKLIAALLYYQVSTYRKRCTLRHRYFHRPPTRVRIPRHSLGGPYLGNLTPWVNINLHGEGAMSSE